MPKLKKTLTSKSHLKSMDNFISKVKDMPIIKTLSPYFYQDFIESIYTNERFYLNSLMELKKQPSILQPYEATFPNFNQAEWVKFNNVKNPDIEIYEFSLLKFNINENDELDCILNESEILNYFNIGLGFNFPDFKSIPLNLIQQCLSDLYYNLFICMPSCTITEYTMIGYSNIHEVGYNLFDYFISQNNGQTANRKIKYNWNNLEFIKVNINEALKNTIPKYATTFEDFFTKKYLPKNIQE